VSFHTRIRRADKTEYDFAVVLIPLQSHGAVSSVLCIAENITERKRLEEKLFHQANYDALTGVPNRAFFYAQLKHALARHQRKPGRLALMYLDIDEFKNINDTYGHDVGDAVIRTFSARIHSAVRSSDLLARLGGDEFVLMVEDYDNLEGLQFLANKLVQLMESPFVIDNLSLAVRTSVGVSCAQPGMTPDDLVRQADRAMYQAKRAGRNRVSIDTSCY
jgi:diguanylate cyclase (GGDEF)-like protein